MSKSAPCRTMLMVDDDGEDCIFVRDALREIGRSCDFRCVHNGEELFDYLRHQGEYEEGRNVPPPDVILLDLRMPRKNGRETLQELKADPHWRQVPVVVLTTSRAAEDVKFCYDMGVNSYITKPATYRELVEIVRILTQYWFEVAELPPKACHGGKTH